MASSPKDDAAVNSDGFAPIAKNAYTDPDDGGNDSCWSWNSFSAWLTLPTSTKISDDAELEEGSGPNKLSEDVLKCLMSIYFQMSSLKNSGTEFESMPSVSGSFERSEERGFQDPYGICSEFGRRKIDPYKYFCCIEAKSIDLNLTLNLTLGSSLLVRRLKNLLRKLTLVDLSGLTHEQKLAFWINMYSSCMMNVSWP